LPGKPGNMDVSNDTLIRTVSLLSKMFLFWKCLKNQHNVEKHGKCRSVIRKTQLTLAVSKKV